MKLLLDQNLSPRLADALGSAFHGTTHVREFGLSRAPDLEIWDFARARGDTIVSKDSDFYQRSLLYGHPPKVVWIRRGNCSTAAVEAILRDHLDDLLEFDGDPAASFLVLV